MSGFVITGAALLTSFLSAPALASELPICETGPRHHCVVDGDTIWWKGEKIRLMGFDTPEKTPHAHCEKEVVLADRATKRLQGLLGSGYMTIERKGRDKYKRTLAIIRVGGANVGDTLIQEKLARPYKGGRRKSWCR